MKKLDDIKIKIEERFTQSDLKKYAFRRQFSGAFISKQGMKPTLKGSMRLEKTGRSPNKNPKDLDKFNQNFNPDGAALNYYQTKPFTEAPGILL